MPRPRLIIDDLGLTANRLLLPIDLARCPPEIFPVANSFTKPFDGEVLLLHVFEPRQGAARRGVGEGELRRAEQHLERIGQDCLSPKIQASYRVRVGVPAEEIRAEAAARNVDLILLGVFAPSPWRRLLGWDSGRTARDVVVGAPCRVFVIDLRTRFNCFRRWAKEGTWLQSAA